MARLSSSEYVAPTGISVRFVERWVGAHQRRELVALFVIGQYDFDSIGEWSEVFLQFSDCHVRIPCFLDLTCETDCLVDGLRAEWCAR